MRKENSEFQTAFVSEAGSYVENRDYFAFVELDDFACYVIADGLDSDVDARSAEMAVKVMLEHFIHKPGLSKRALIQSFHAAHSWLKSQSHRVRLKASLLVVVTDYTRIRWASVGHARLYHLRGGRVHQWSRDQSLAELMNPDDTQAHDWTTRHAERHNLLQYLGTPEELRPVVSDKVKLQDGDQLLLCTAGFWERVEIPELMDAAEDASTPSQLADTLEELLLSKQEGCVENYTAAAVYANKVFAEKPKNRMKWVKTALISLLSLALLGGGIWFMKAKEIAALAEAAEQMLENQESGDEYALAGDYAKALKAYSEAKNAASKLKDRYHAQLLRDKQRVAQLLTDGEEYLKDKDYDKATNSFTSGLESAAKYEVFREEDIRQKLTRTKVFAEVDQALNDAELKMQAQQYNEALRLYKKANVTAIEAGYTVAQKELQLKMEQAQGKLDHIYSETQSLRADKLEKQGDKVLAALNYTSAIEYYAQAQEIYQEIDKLERVLSMERKITKAYEKLNPIVPVDTGGASDNAKAGALTDMNSNESESDNLAMHDEEAPVSSPSQEASSNVQAGHLEPASRTAASEAKGK